MRYSLFSAAAALAVAQLATGQTFTECDPTKKTCPKDIALGKTLDVDFTAGSSPHFEELPGTKLTYGANGAEFIINEETNAPTVESPWYIFFGRVEVVLKASHGQGIVSSFVLESDDLDEVDWEWLGGDFEQVQTNYFGKGNTTTYDRGKYHPIAKPQEGFHTYAIDWTAESLKWYIDGNLIRTLLYAEANGGHNYPQTPMKVKMGNWVGGSSTAPDGTVQWAGGLTDFSKAPFTMYVKSIKVTDAQTGAKSYTYGDMTGSWESIVIDNGDGTQSSETPTKSSTSKTASPTKTSSSAVESSTSKSASTTKTSATTLTTASSTDAESTETATSANDSATPTGDSETSATSDAATSASVIPNSADKFGASFAMVVLGAAVTFFAL